MKHSSRSPQVLAAAAFVVGGAAMISWWGCDSAPKAVGLPVPAPPAAQAPMLNLTDVTAGSGFGFSVAVEDSLDNVETGFVGNVTVAIATNPAAGSLGGTLVALPVVLPVLPRADILSNCNRLSSAGTLGQFLQTALGLAKVC